MPATYPLNLCQPDDRKSCGACCGLYNWKDHSRGNLQRLLLHQTERFLTIGKIDGVNAYKNSLNPFPSGQKLCKTIYNCEFLGFLHRDQKRIGCLLHPSLHKGIDLRVCSFYGSQMCAGHYCTSFSYLTVTEQKAVIVSIDDWYLYGLVITDIDLVKEFFNIVQNRMGESIDAEKLEDREVRNALDDFFRLKQSWKFSAGKGRFGKYFFSHAEYSIARIEYEKRWNSKPSQFDKIFLSLASEFKTKEQIIEAEQIIEDKIEEFLHAYSRA